MKFSIRWMPLLVTAATLAACGGGGNSPTAGTPYVDGVVTGVAATGAAIVGGTVTLKCVSGTTVSKVTGSDGSFSIDVGGVTLPCVGRVTYPGGTLHTFISAPGVANITPVTDLLVARLTGAAPAAAFDSFDANKVKAYSAPQVSAAALAVKSYIKDTLGVDVSNLPDDPVASSFKAATGSTLGDKVDALLDALKAKLSSSGKTLGEVATILASGTPTGGTGSTGAATGSTGGTGSTGTGSGSSTGGSCAAGSVSFPFSGGSAAGSPFTNGQVVCFIATSTSLNVGGKVLTSVARNELVTAPFSAFKFTDSSAGVLYEVIFEGGNLYEINVSNISGTVFYGQFAPAV